ncbi:peptidoglycan-binding protein [Aestuariimicrobium sp. p3-SID1156]|uniref:peptidoglycan-binding protein n=1 Tax=Aestuariimicrobium sp. p3-SID1156 TaxID=2916038 RepID=UPI00223C18B6|nr:peptidoglycan-binding protein [Aestuariimicrobium sp. p3-SID1156]MCT1460279.1 peptidoglycan-binding protein [Aestuariimicrobium sp. p3-SID1156]
MSPVSRRSLLVTGGAAAAAFGLGSAVRAEGAQFTSNSAFLAAAASAAQTANKVAPRVPVAPMIAQAILESGWGTTTLAAYNNFFGQKAKLGDRDPYSIGTVWVKTWEYQGQEEYAEFHKYASMADSFKSHYLYVSGQTGLSQYRNPPSDTDQFCRWLVTAPRAYATAGCAPGSVISPTCSTYDDKLIQLINTYGLRKYNLTSGGGSTCGNPGTPSSRSFPTLKAGSNGTSVRTLQYILNNTGYYRLTVTGVFDAATKSAVVAYQKRHGFTADGIAGSRFWSTILPTVSTAETSSAARAIQRELNDYCYGVPVTGVYDSTTRNSVIAWQRNRGLPADGVVRASTWATFLNS